MNNAQIESIVIACIISAGGIGGITIAVIKFSSSIIAERLSTKYENTEIYNKWMKHNNIIRKYLASLDVF